jgi:hypothetical protein
MCLLRKMGVPTAAILLAAPRIRPHVYTYVVNISIHNLPIRSLILLSSKMLNFVNSLFKTMPPSTKSRKVEQCLDSQGCISKV